MDDTIVATPSCGEETPEELAKRKLQAERKVSSLCTKCKTKSAALLFRKDSTCGECFVYLVLKKYKQTLNVGRKSKNTSEHVLLALSGGPSSTAMLHIMSLCIAERESKNTFFEVSVIHIDESSALGLSDAERSLNNTKIEQMVKKYGYKLTIVPLEKVYTLGTSPKPEDSVALKKLIDSASSNTSKEDLLHHLRTKLLTSEAKDLKVDKLLIGSSATRLAAQLISSTCKGKGFALPHELASLETKWNGVEFLRPMRDFLAKEIAFYNYYNKLEVHTMPALDTMTHMKFSIDHLSENFIENLQADFSHTVHTLLRSASKLSVPTSPVYCSLCLSVLSTAEIDQIKLASSSKCSVQQCDSCVVPCGSDTLDLRNYVCYGCSRVVRESDSSLLPSFVSKNAHELYLRDQIKDFLIEEK